MPLLPTPLPTPVLGSIVPTSGGGANGLGGSGSYDFAIAGQPFLSAANDENPLIRESAAVRKEQLDTAREAGEGTLGFWWLRSQSSFHGGAGLRYAESPDVDPSVARIRFDTSKGVDVWTRGQVTALPDSNLYFASAAQVFTAQVMSGASEDVFYGAGTVTGTVNTGPGSSMTSTILSVTSDGVNGYVATAAGVWKCPPGGAATQLYHFTGARVVLGFAKQRLICGVDNDLYELSTSAANLAVPPALTHVDNAEWRWTAVAEGPDSIWAAGYAGTSSAIYRHTLSQGSDSEPPALLPGAVGAVLPEGERVVSMAAYLQSYIGVGTTKGIRACTVDQIYGYITLGPLSVRTDTPVYGLVGHDRFLYGSGTSLLPNSEACLVRVDLSQPVAESGELAWATDLLTPAGQQGAVRSVCFLRDRAFFSVDNVGLVGAVNLQPGFEHPAWIKTSRIRYDTVEPKTFEVGQIRGEWTAGVEVHVETPANPDTKILDYSGLVDPKPFSVAFGPLEWVALTITFGGPDTVLNSYQLKALPAAERPRQVTLPLLCFDYESDRNDQEHGWDGFARQRLNAIELADRLRDTVVFEEFLPDQPPISVLAKIENVRFVKTTPTERVRGFGGLLAVTLTTITS